MFAAARTIVAGEAVGADDLTVVDVALGHVEGAYASPASLTPGSVATRTIPEGQLVAKDAIGDAAGLRTTTVVVHSATELPAAVGPGSTVEVWAAPQLERGQYDKPRILVASATVVSVTADDTMIGSAGSAVELVIERAEVADTLAAISGGASLSIVPTSAVQP